MPDVYIVMGEVEEGVLRIPSNLRLERTAPTQETPLVIPVKSATAHHEEVSEVPQGTKAGITLGGYVYDRGTGLYPKRVPNLFGLKKADRLVSP